MPCYEKIDMNGIENFMYDSYCYVVIANYVIKIARWPIDVALRT
jgi:hypothetical protein